MRTSNSLEIGLIVSQCALGIQHIRIDGFHRGQQNVRIQAERRHRVGHVQARIAAQELSQLLDHVMGIAGGVLGKLAACTESRWVGGQAGAGSGWKPGIRQVRDRTRIVHAGTELPEQDIHRGVAGMVQQILLLDLVVTWSE